MDKIIKKTITGVMLCVACITICACNGKALYEKAWPECLLWPEVIKIHNCSVPS